MQIFDDRKNRIGTLTGFRERTITKTLDSGDKELSFKYPSNGKLIHLLKEEYYIRTKEDEFILKAVERGEQYNKYNKYTATLNVEELEGQSFPYGFASQEQTIRACLEFAFDGTGWTVGICTVTKKRTIDIEESTTAWSVLQSCLSTYRCECEIDSLNKVVNIYEQIGNDRGCYFMEGLNLRKLTANSDTYEFYTRIIPIGKDGITIEWLHGKEYLENYQYSSKVKTYTWKDERYTNTTSLMEDAEAKLEELSKPYKVFSADVVDLAKANPEYKDILDYGIGDTVRMVSRHPRMQEKQRIVKIVEYPETPEKNTVELSNTTKTFAEVQKTETELAKTEAVSIANNRTKKILEDNYYTKTETESHITASAEAISLGVAEKYETKEVVSEKTANAEAAANRATDEKLTEYSTTQEMQSAINMTAQSINLSVAETYATKVTVTEKYNSAIEAGQNAADEAEAAANRATDEKLTQYSTTQEMQSAINMTAQSINLSVSETYATKVTVTEKYNSAIEAGQNAADEAEAAANRATDEKLTQYSTTQEMQSAIDMTAKSINLSVSETYATKGTVTEKYNSAIEAGQNAADEAEAAANRATDEKLTEYSTTVEMDAILNLTKESILQQVKRVEESSMHDYVTNGDFSDGLNEWYTSSEDNIVFDDSTLGTVAKILKSSSSTSYIRQSLGTLPAGTYRVRYKAATAAGYEATARVKCSALGSTATTEEGLLKSTEFVTVEREITVTASGTKYIYFYAYVQDSPVYIKDVEVLGQYSLYADAKLQVTADEITSEVNKKVNSDEFGTLITQNAYNVKIAWNKNSNYIQFEGNGITLYNGTIDDNQKRTVFNYSGEHFYLDGYYVGNIGTNSMKSNDSQKGLVFDLENQAAYMTWAWKESANADEYTMKWTYSAQQCGNYDAGTLHAGADIDMHNFTIKNPKWEGGGITATINYVQVLKVNSDGTIARWGDSGKMVFQNGILTDLTYYT